MYVFITTYMNKLMMMLGWEATSREKHPTETGEIVYIEFVCMCVWERCRMFLHLQTFLPQCACICVRGTRSTQHLIIWRSQSGKSKLRPVNLLWNTFPLTPLCALSLCLLPLQGGEGPRMECKWKQKKKKNERKRKERKTWNQQDLH